MIPTRLSRLSAPFFVGPFVLGVALAGAPALSPALAQSPMPGHGGGMMPGHAGGGGAMPQDPASRAYMESMRTMSQGMMGQRMTGDADRDFASMMIVHHQGAIDMARVQLDHGKDPDLRKMARKVIDDQSREIAELKSWLDRHPADAGRK